MAKPRTLANFVSAGNPFADGDIDVSDINDLTATAAELNHVSGVTSAVQTQLNAKAATADIGVTIQAYDADTAKLDVIQTFTANQTVTAEFIATSYNETFVSLSGTTPTVDCEAGNVFALATSDNTTFTFSNPPASGTAYGFTLKVTAGGAHTLTWPASVDWAGGSAPDSPDSGETDVFVFFTHDGGTTWYGFKAGDALA